MGHLHETGGEGAIERVAFLLATGGEAGDGRAVIVAVAVENLPFLAAVDLVADLADHLEGFLVRLGPGVGVIDAGQARHLFGQTLGELGAGDRALGSGEIAEFRQLAGDSVGNLFAPVADVHGPDAAGHGVDVFLAGQVPDAEALALDDDLGVDGLEGLVLDEVVPDMGAVGLDQLAGVIGKERVHGAWLSTMTEGRRRRFSPSPVIAAGCARSCRRQ